MSSVLWCTDMHCFTVIPAQRILPSCSSTALHAGRLWSSIPTFASYYFLVCPPPPACSACVGMHGIQQSLVHYLPTYHQLQRNNLRSRYSLCAILIGEYTFLLSIPHIRMLDAGTTSTLIKTQKYVHETRLPANPYNWYIWRQIFQAFSKVWGVCISPANTRYLPSAQHNRWDLEYSSKLRDASWSQMQDQSARRSPRRPGCSWCMYLGKKL